jgi:hypothetical protein
VSEPMRALMNDLVREVIRAWRQEFCRSISIKLNAGYLLPFCDALPSYMRKEVGKYAREMGLNAGDDGGAGEGGEDARTSQLRERIELGLKERDMLQRMAARMPPKMRAPSKAGGG